MRNSKIEKKMDFFPYSMLRKRFQTRLLNSMTKYTKENHPHLYNEFKKIVNKIYKTSKNGFYVRTPKQQFKDIKGGLQYILRYCGRPVFASSRIISIKDNYITFWYQRHENDKYVVEKSSYIRLSKKNNYAHTRKRFQNS